MPTPFLSAAFPGADGTPLSSVLYDGVHAWTRSAAGSGSEAVLSSARAKAQSTTQSYYVATSATPASADYRVAASLYAVSGTRSTAGVVARANAAGTAFTFFGYIGGNWAVWVDGAEPAGATRTAVTPTDGVQYDLVLVCDGRFARGYVNGVLVATAASTGAGAAGLWLEGLGWEMSGVTATDGPAWAAQFSDTFTRADASTAGNGWVDAPSSRSTIAGNALRLAGRASSGDILLYPVNYTRRPIGEAALAQRVTVDFTAAISDQGGGTAPYRIACLRQQADLSGIMVGLSATALDIYTIAAGGSAITNIKTVAFSANTAHSYRLRAAITTDVGTTAAIMAELWDLSTDPTAAGAPAVTAFASSTAVTTAGVVSLDNNDTAVLFDNVVIESGDASAPPPPATQVLPANHAALLYSPYNWRATTESGAPVAITPHPGAYVRTTFTGAICRLLFNMAQLASPAPILAVRVDGGAWTMYTMADVVDVSPAGSGTHTLEVVVNGMRTDAQNRWAGTTAATRFLGLRIGASDSASAPAARALRFPAFTDSIPETFNAAGTSGGFPASFDAHTSFVLRAAELLNAEVGIIGFAGQGITHGPGDGTPAVVTSYASLYSGVARSFSPAPDFILVAEGTNDGTTDTTALVTTLVNALLSLTPGPVVWLRPLNGTSQAAFLANGLTASTAHTRAKYVDTAGWISDPSTQYTDGLHPTAAWHQGTGGTLLAAALTAALAPPAPTQTPLQKRRRDMVITLAITRR